MGILIINCVSELPLGAFSPRKIPVSPKLLQASQMTLWLCHTLSDSPDHNLTFPKSLETRDDSSFCNALTQYLSTPLNGFFTPIHSHPMS